MSQSIVSQTFPGVQTFKRPAERWTITTVTIAAAAATTVKSSP